MIRTAAIDAGNDSLKAIFGDIKAKPLIIPNVVSKLQERKTVDDTNDPLDELHVKITSSALKTSGTYAVGNLAAKRTDNEHIRSNAFKSENDQTIILMLTALAIDAAKNNLKDKIVNVKYVLSTGLPVDEAKIEGQRKAFREKLIDATHEVVFEKTPKYGGRMVKIEFEEVFVNVEGYAAMINMTMDDQFKPANLDLMKKTILINDMGGNTTDKAVIKNGKIDNDYSNGSLLGVGNYLDDIIEDVNREFRTKAFKSRRELVECITHEDDKERNYIWSTGSAQSIKSIVESHFQILAKEQYDEIERTWNRVGRMHAVYNVGGTAILIQDYLEKENEARNKYEMHFLESDESIHSIVKAYYKMLILQAKKKGLNIEEAIPTA
ncbi:ParM/StbA family protein [Fictibacillus sp. 5RED26]|uniref:ParM/StbA family protein n=1 Tax=Fictibacillus sp. 5RED26 TaxID=2745876 RepID=UPI0018CD95CE|nr:ParM/StbA family protein [Fictibacillus sp. 5RED26]MBH0159096.1 ParM/StbA family protein [Fictibacillus sp. 5RED26]